MSEYYGVSTPTDDFLAHYGVKGMKWGVRKAIEKGNEKKLAKHYLKSMRKLGRKEFNANIDEQKKLANSHNKVAKVGAKVGLASLGVATGAHGVYQILNNKYLKAHSDFYHPGWDLEAINSGKLFDAGDKNAYDAYRAKRLLEAKNLEDSAHNLTTHGNRAITVKELAGNVGAIGLGMAAGAKILAANAKRKTKPEGHAKMVAKRDAWKNQMADAFKGTKYAKFPDYGKVYYQQHKKRLDKQSKIVDRYDQLTKNRRFKQKYS